MNKRSCSLAVIAVFCVVLGCSQLFAQHYVVENQAERLYGEGVHAFFDGNYWKAAEILKQVKSLGSEDPRPYFFLGLAYSRLGMEDEAKAALKTASAFEWEGRASRDYGVSDALRRIQGIERLYVEAFRKKAKMNWEQAELKRDQERYGQEKGTDRSILKSLTKGSELPPPPKQEPFVGTAPHGASSVDPFRGADETDKHSIQEDGAAPKPVPTVAPKKKTDEPKKEEMKEDDESAPVEPEKKADEPKKEEKKADDEDPFGMSDEPEKKADESKKEEKKADDEDPFASSDEPAKKADEPKKEEKKDEKKADEDDDDPFK